MSSISYHIKTERTFTLIRKYAWLVTVIVALGGQFLPELGLVVPLIMLALMATSLFKGRYWCGNFCPHGSLYDQLILPLSRNKNIPGFLKSRFFVAFFFIFFLFNLSRRFISLFQQMNNPFQQTGFIFSNTYLMVLLAGGLLGIFISPRTWCQFCPMGTIQLLFYRLGKGLEINSKSDERITISAKELCHSCGKCARVCPMQLKPYLQFNSQNQLESEECIRCNTCVENCPAGILQLASKSKSEEIRKKTSLDGFDRADFYQARIKKIRELKEDIREFTFELMDAASMEFKPGQFVLIEVMEEEEMYRAYTISRSSEDSQEISITVKLLEDGYGTNLLFNDFKEGDRVTLKGPLGRELVVDPKNEKVLFLANGIGITPFVCMVQCLLAEKDFSGQATLLYGARYEEDLIYHQFFSQAAEENPHFNYQQILSRPKGDNYRQGYVTHLIEEMELSPDYKVYICGSPAMASDSMEILKNKGIPAENIHYEDFAV